MAACSRTLASAACCADEVLPDGIATPARQDVAASEDELEMAASHLQSDGSDAEEVCCSCISFWIATKGAAAF